MRPHTPPQPPPGCSRCSGPLAGVWPGQGHSFPAHPHSPVALFPTEFGQSLWGKRMFWTMKCKWLFQAPGIPSTLQPQTPMQRHVNKRRQCGFHPRICPMVDGSMPVSPRSSPQSHPSTVECVCPKQLLTSPLTLLGCSQILR